MSVPRTSIIQIFTEIVLCTKYYVRKKGCKNPYCHSSPFSIRLLRKLRTFLRIYLYPPCGIMVRLLEENTCRSGNLSMTEVPRNFTLPVQLTLDFQQFAKILRLIFSKLMVSCGFCSRKQRKRKGQQKCNKSWTFTPLTPIPGIFQVFYVYSPPNPYLWLQSPQHPSKLAPIHQYELQLILGHHGSQMLA